MNATTRRLAALAALTLVGASLTATPAQADTQTAGCTDRSGVRWSAKVVWGDDYLTTDGTTRVRVDWAGWTTNARTVPTDSAVQTYDGAGRLLQTLRRTETVDYQGGTVWRARNPTNPPSGGAKIRVTLGVDGDGLGDCTVNFAQPTTPVSGIPLKQLVFADDFNGTALDTSKWSDHRWSTTGETPYNPDVEEAWYHPAATTVRDGHLVQTVTYQPKTLNGKTFRYRSGVVTTEGKFAIRPGSYTEARILVPIGDRLWPAWWSNCAGNCWPPEIDIFEYFNTATQAQPRFNYHYADRRQSGQETYGEAGVDYRGTFHTYGVLWTLDGKVTPYLDGKAYPHATVSGVEPNPQTLILNLAVNRDGRPASGIQYRIDWVRSYR